MPPQDNTPTPDLGGDGSAPVAPDPGTAPAPEPSLPPTQPSPTPEPPAPDAGPDAPQQSGDEAGGPA